VIVAGDVAADEADLEALFRAHATPLLRLAVALTGDPGVAEELVQDAFVALARQARPPRAGAELAYLRRTVVNLSHGRHRHLAVVRRSPEQTLPSIPAAETGAARRDVQRRVADAVRALPARQRDCMVLRCYAEATDVEIADALGISAGSVKTHLHRARATLARLLEDLR
jgi:RNA polymerase sigma factor (sigma-70 family)